MNNYNHLNYSWYNNGLRNKNYYLNINNNQDLYSPKEGFEKGNMFPNLYSEYKGYQPQELKPISEQEEKLLNIQMICFAAHDINLYLDNHPDDQSMIMLFNDYKKQKDQLMSEYETKYGPITLDSSNIGKDKFSWIDSPWPWEVNNV